VTLVGLTLFLTDPGSRVEPAAERRSGAHYGGASAVELHHASLFSLDPGDFSPEHRGTSSTMAR